MTGTEEAKTNPEFGGIRKKEREAKKWTDFNPGMGRQGGKETMKGNISQGKPWRHAEPVAEDVLEMLP